MPSEAVGPPKNILRPPLSCMFLCNFEMKKGNETVWSCKWSETDCDVNLENIEFKSLPSGVHGVTDDVINFSIPKKTPGDDLHYGVAYYQQNGQEVAREGGQLDRKNVKMYALGIIVDSRYSEVETADDAMNSWRPERFNSANEYVNDLKQLLSYWLAKKDFQEYGLFENYFKCNSLIEDDSRATSPIVPRSPRIARELISHDGDFTPDDAGRPQMLEYLPYWIRRLGPLIFPLWKSCLLDERILIINPPGGSFEVCNALSYCLSYLSLVPKGLQGNRHYDRYLRPLFTIGISDIDKMAYDVKKARENNEKLPGFVACTSDEILSCKTELYDKVLRIPNDSKDQDQDVCTLYTSSDMQIKATPNDFECLQTFYQNYLNEDLSQPEKSRLSQTVEPVSWTQYIIDEIYWWTTAGYVKPFYHEHLDARKAEMDEQAEMIPAISDYFREKTAGLYNRLKMVVESNERQGPDDLILIPFSTLSEVGLDLFSVQDRETIIALAWMWFQREVKINGEYCEAVC